MIYRIVFFLLFALDTQAQLSTGPRFTAMGKTGTALQDPYSLYSNPAGIANLKNPFTAISIEDHFFGNDIHSQSVMLVYPTRLGVLGYRIQNYGIQSAYGELTSGISFARIFGDQFSLALRLNYHQLKIPNYGSSVTFSVDFGAQYYLSDIWILGIQFENPGNFKPNGDHYTQIPKQFHLGTSYRFSEQVLVAVDGRYSGKGKADASLGLEYAIVEWLKLRGGLSLNQFQHYAGFGFGYNRFLFDTAVTVHPSLGISPQIAIGYSF